MKIVICGSMTASKTMLAAAQRLAEQGHSVVVPKFTKEYARMNSADEMHTESTKHKVEHDLIRHYFNEIKRADAVLVVNEKRRGIDNYVGGNSLMEMGFAYVLNKKIFLLNPVPDVPDADEIRAMQPIIIRGDYAKIR